MEKKENIYSRGKIYKIISENSDNIYVGSTCQKLSLRLACHVRNFKCQDIDKKYCSSYEIIKQEDYTIILIEDFPCESKHELRARERFWTDELRPLCVNIKNANYTEDDRTNSIRNYYINHKEQLSAHKKIEKLCDVCDIMVQNGNACRHTRTKMHIKNLEQRANNS